MATDGPTRASESGFPIAPLYDAGDVADGLEEREVRLLGVRAEMAMPDDGDPVERTPVRGRI